MPRQITRVEIRKVPMRGAATRGVSVVTNERGAAFLETAVTLPIVLMICVGVFEFAGDHHEIVMPEIGREIAGAQLMLDSARGDADEGGE